MAVFRRSRIFNPLQRCFQVVSNSGCMLSDLRTDIVFCAVIVSDRVSDVLVYHICDSPLGLTFTWWACCGYVFDRACPLLIIFCSCVYVCPYGSFNCISFRKVSQQLSAFSLYSSGLISAFQLHISL